MHEHVKKNIKEKNNNNNNKNYNRWQWIMVVGDEQKKKEKIKKKKVETWQVVREIDWCEKNNKNKWHMCLLTGDIKLVCTLSFTFEGNYGTNLEIW